MQNDMENKIEILILLARSQNRQLDLIQKRIDSLRGETDRAKRKLDCAIVAAMILCVLVILAAVGLNL